MRTHSIISLVCACLLVATASIPAIASADGDREENGAPTDADNHSSVCEKQSIEDVMLENITLENVTLENVTVENITVTHTDGTQQQVTILVCYDYDYVVVGVGIGPPGATTAAAVSWYIGEIPAGEKSVCIGAGVYAFGVGDTVHRCYER